MLSQQAADYLARVAKHMSTSTVAVVPAPGSRKEWDAQAYGTRDRFTLHLYRGRRVQTKITLQEQHDSSAILLRLDIDGPTHTNPDGQVVPTPHLHIYQAGYDDGWAFPVPAELDISSGDPTQILIGFLTYCGVDPLPSVQGGLQI